MKTKQTETNHRMSVEPIVLTLEKCKEGVTIDQVKKAIGLLEDALIEAEEHTNKLTDAKEGLEELILSISSEPSMDEEILAKLDDCIDDLNEINY